jgi:hypothetical protein
VPGIGERAITWLVDLFLEIYSGIISAIGDLLGDLEEVLDFVDDFPGMTVDFFLLFFRGSERFFFIIESKRSL